MESPNRRSEPPRPARAPSPGRHARKAPRHRLRSAIARRQARSVLGGVVISVIACGLTLTVVAGWLASVSSRVPRFELADATSLPSPPGWRTVRYQGVRLAVPRSWPVVNLHTHPRVCPRLDVHAVYLGVPGPDPRCPASGLGAKTAAVQIAPALAGSPQVVGATLPTTIGGTRALTTPAPGASHTITDVFPGVRAEVDLSYGTDEALIWQVQSTITVARQQGVRPLLSMPAHALPASHTQGVVGGLGFDTCSAPSAGSMQAWLGSRYRSVGVYIGGADEACAQPNLSASWIDTVERQGWHVFPLYVGPQAPCVNALGVFTFSAEAAVSAGRSAAADAARQAQNLRLPQGTPLIYDMEGYSGCGQAVVAFLNAWDRKLNSEGYASGVYESSSNVGDLAAATHAITKPRILFYANWDGQAATNSPYIPSAMWVNHQRIHQYLGNSTETYGGITLNIDRDKLNANLGGVTVQGRPQTAVVDSGGTVRVYDRGNKGGPLWEDHLNAARGSSWSWFNMKGNWSLSPTAVVGSDGTVHVFAVGTDEHLYERHLPPGGTWSAWVSLGGRWPRAPSAAAGPSGTVRVFGVGTNGHLYQKRLRTSGTWSGWSEVGGSHLTGTPVATYDPTGVTHVYVRSAAGPLDVATLAPGKPWAWHSLHGIWRYDAAAVVGRNGSAHVYAVGTDGHLYQLRLRASGTWSGWRDVGGSNLTGTPAAVVDQTGVIRVFTRVKSGALTEQYHNPGSGWAQTNLHGTWPHDASAVVDSSDTVRVYGVGTTGALYEDHMRAGGPWSGWFELGGP
jgi:Domain of unknown function (DUF1906)